MSNPDFDAIHPRGDNPANTGQFSTKTHADAENVVLAARLSEWGRAVSSQILDALGPFRDVTITEENPESGRPYVRATWNEGETAFEVDVDAFHIQRCATWTDDGPLLEDDSNQGFISDYVPYRENGGVGEQALDLVALARIQKNLDRGINRALRQLHIDDRWTPNKKSAYDTMRVKVVDPLPHGVELALCDDRQEWDRTSDQLRVEMDARANRINAVTVHTQFGDVTTAERPQINDLLFQYQAEATLVGGSANYAAHGSPLGEYVPGDPARSASNVERALADAMI